MRTRSYDEMLQTYGTTAIDPEDLAERQEKLSSLKYSVIVEGNFAEYENAAKWIEDNLNISPIDFVFYGKLSYDYGFIEYFLLSESDCEKFRNIVPDLYTTYRDGSISKSDGYNRNVLRN